MPAIVILADDLSGAADCGIVFAEAGLDTRVALRSTGADPAVAVLAVDGDTRSRSRDDALSVTEQLVRTHGGGGRTLFRKVDSTLRGHLAAELAVTLAVRREAGPAVAILAPAFPAAGRTTRNGHQHLDGIALEHTALWRREGMPGRAHLPDMLATAGLTAAVIPLDLLHGPDGAATLRDRARHHDVLVADIERDSDLALLVRAARLVEPEIVWAGSSGLARHLVPLDAVRHRVRPFSPALGGPVLFVVGSASAISRRQAATLGRGAPVATVVVQIETLRAGPAAPTWTRAQTDLRHALATGDTLVTLGEESPDDLAEGALLCRALAALIVPEMAAAAALVATGGETARAVLDRMGATGLRLVGELEAGVPLSLLEGARAIPVITKAGAFGTENTLLRCRDVLHAATAPTE